MTSTSTPFMCLLCLCLHPDCDPANLFGEEEVDWRELYAAAFRHKMLALTYSAALRLNDYEQMRGGLTASRQVLSKWYAWTNHIQADNEQALRDNQSICRYFAEHGFSVAVMKGEANALRYPNPLLRNVGDIDLWVAGGFRRVNAFVQQVCPTHEVNELEIQFTLFPKIPVEVHYRPMILRNPFTNRRLQRFFASQAAACFQHSQTFACGAHTVTFPTTTVTFDLVHQLAHIYLHFFTEGIGMRQVVDYYYLLMAASHETVDNELVRRVVQETGLTRFAQALMWVLVEPLRMPAEAALWPAAAADGAFLLQEILKSGNFGRADANLMQQKRSPFASLYLSMCRNIRYHRFAPTDWLWAPLWRLYHHLWRACHGFL